jgi:rSAM/selenodomain-associated transferase 1
MTHSERTPVPAGLTLMVIAKEPVPGKVKTRLCPPLTHDQAATVAAASLADTLAAMAETPAHRRLVVLEGAADGLVPAGFDVVAQVSGGLDARLAAAFTEVDGPALIVGMDTPQITPGLLAETAAQLVDHDAVLGPATDGGFWVIGFAAPHPEAFTGVPMSRSDTGARQHARLRELGLSVAEVAELTDVDTADDLLSVADAAPGSHFAAAIAGLTTDRIDFANVRGNEARSADESCCVFPS